MSIGITNNMIPLYGSKSKIVKLYPAPLWDTIVEPFAGSARYSLEHWKNNVILIEKDAIIAGIWKWLQMCSAKDILGLPNMKAGEHVDSYRFDCQEAKWLMGFMINQGSTTPKKTVSSVGGFGSSERAKKFVADNLYKIRHWEIIHGDYAECSPSFPATWFIDPPYIVKGIYYRESSKNINFESLGEWCRSRQGQVMVCENAGATWLPFEPFATTNGSIKTSKEVVWYN